MGVGQAGIAALPAVMQTTLDSNLVGLPFFEKDAGVSGSAYPAIFTGGPCAA